MSVSYYADLVVGIKLKRDDLYAEKEVPGCKHKVPSGSKFCPKCGKPATRIDRKPLPKFDEDENYGDLDISRIGYESEDLVVGRKLAGVGGYCDEDAASVSVQAITDAKDEVMEKLEGEPLRGEFGIWLCVHCG